MTPPAHDLIARSLVIPMKDEATRIGATLRAIGASGLRAPGLELVLVDDGSSDGTAAIAEELLRTLHLPGRVVRLASNRGKGAAVAAGMAVASGASVAFVDADLSTPPDAVLAVFELVEAGKADVVTTTRVHPDATITALPPANRRYSGKAFNLLVRALGLSELDDTQCGLKGFTADAAAALFRDLRVQRFAFDVEVLARARRAGYSVLELPVEWAHVEASRVRPVQDGSRMALDVLRLRWSLRRWSPDPPSTMADERFEVMARLERDHWWFAAKRQLVAQVVRARVTPGGPAADVGCGTGAMAADLAELGFDPVAGSDLSPTAVGLASGTLGGAAVAATAEALPYPDAAVRCLTSLDVLEHLDDDVAALREYRRVVAPDGLVVLTVPAYRWAWSDHDVALGHRRRYTVPMLRAAAEAAGLRVEHVSYFHSWLVPPALVLRRTPLGRLQRGSAEEASYVSPAVNRALAALAGVDVALAGRRGLPFGLSILLVARR